MLEEELRSPTFSPAEAAQDLLSFIRFELSDGNGGYNHSAERRFITLFSLVCDRLFGSMGGPKEHYRHSIGGWLGRQHVWDRTPNIINNNDTKFIANSTNRQHGQRNDPFGPSSPNASRRRHTVSGSIHNDPVVQLLCGVESSPSSTNSHHGSTTRRTSHQRQGTPIHLKPPTFIEVIEGNHDPRRGVRIQFPFHALPKSTQEEVMKLLAVQQQQQQLDDMTRMDVDGAGENTSSSPRFVNHDLVDGLSNDSDDDFRSNVGRIFFLLLRVSARDQHDVRRWCFAQAKQRDQDAATGSINAYSVSHQVQPISLLSSQYSDDSINSPSTNNAMLHHPLQLAMSNDSVNKDKINFKSDTSPQLSLNMVEYYLFTFIRYPTAPPLPTQPAPQGLPPSGGRSTHHHRNYTNRSNHYGDKVYQYLFQCYLHHYIPNIDNYHSQHQRGSTSNGAFVYLTRVSELFVRLVAEFWLSNNSGGTTMVSIKQAVESAKERYQKQRQMQQFGTMQQFATNTTVVTFDLDSMYDLVKMTVPCSVATPFDPPKPVVLHGIKHLVRHVLRDPNLAHAVKECHDIISFQQEAVQGIRPPDSPWCQSPVMSVLSQPFFKYILMTFRYAPIHTSASAFYTALDCWLLWLEPWNVEWRNKNVPTMSDFSSSPRKAGNMLVNTVSNTLSAATKSSSFPSMTNKTDFVSVLKVPRHTARSRFHSTWKPYIVANLHFYTVPLALFLRRARELDFSEHSFGKSFADVQRVFRVYTPEIISLLNEVLNSSSDPHYHYSSLVQKHNEILGSFSPSHLGRLSLMSLRNDMQALLEEIYLQHQKSIAERSFWDRIENALEQAFSFIGITDSTKAQEKRITSLAERGKLLANFPPDFAILPSFSDNDVGRRVFSRSSSIGSMMDDDDAINIRRNGVLTETGYQKLLRGEIKCRPTDVDFFPTSNRRQHIKPHEITWLVTLTKVLSDFLNKKLGLVDSETEMPVDDQDPADPFVRGYEKVENKRQKQGFHINLRFFADYRNLLFVICVVWWFRRYYF